MEGCESVCEEEVDKYRDSQGGTGEMGIREVFLKEWYQNRLWICSSEDKMGSRVSGRGSSTSKCTEVSASWGLLTTHSGKFTVSSHSALERDEAKGADRVL